MSFSVLLSVYKGESPHFLEQAIESIYYQQIVKPSQVVIVKDGSLTKELEVVLQRYKLALQEKITIVSLLKNVGLGAALNAGLEYCCHNLVARMDTDDIATPDRFEKQLAFMRNNLDVDIVGSFASDINESGEFLVTRSVPTEHDKIYKLMWTCPLIHPSIMFKKNVVLNAGSYSKTLKRRQDYDLWFRCAQDGARFANIPEALIQYRITDNTYARNSLQVSWQQAMIGFKGCRSLSLGAKAHIGVFYPVVKALLPLKVRKALEGLIKRFDPRRSQ